MGVVLGADALDVVAQVAEVLAPYEPDDVWHWSLARGSAGIALFLAETGLALDDARLADAGADLLDRAVDAAAAYPASTSLFSGTVGVGWVLSHLDGRLLDASGALGDVDDLVLSSIETYPYVADLTDGLVGIGVYLLSRPVTDEVRDGLARIVRRLATTVDAAGTWWRTPDTLVPDELERYPQGYLSLGMAHGQPGVMAFLASCTGVGVTGAAELLRRATDAMTAYASPADDAVGRYPVVVSGDRPTPPGSRVAWCYGDPGVAVALLAAGRALSDDAVTDEGRATARAAARRPFAGSENVDSGLCHGSAGLVHVFNRLHDSTGEQACADAAKRWYDVLLRQRVDGAPYAGFQAILDVKDGHIPVPGFLEGAAGAGLALLTGALPGTYGWDAVLLTAR